MSPLETLQAVFRFWRFRLRKNRHELAYLSRHVTNGMTVLDVGANKGAFTYWLSRYVGPQGRVYAFEPQPELRPYLAYLKSSFKLTNVIIVDEALSDKTGCETMFRETVGAGHATFDGRRRYSEQFPVRKTTLDAFVERASLTDIAFIKIDVERHEHAVLAGGLETIKRFRPALLIEVHGDLAAQGEVFPVLRDLGYEWFHFRKSGKERSVRSEFGSCTVPNRDYFCVPQESVCWPVDAATK